MQLVNRTIKIPNNPCAFHQQNLITHFCRYSQCLLPLCRDCLSIHRKEHNSKKQSIQLSGIEEQTYAVHCNISDQSVRLEQVYKEIVAKVNHSNHLHAKLKKNILHERDALLHSITLYYDSLSQEIDHNFHRRQMWLKEITTLYNTVQQEMSTIQARLQGQKHLRTIIMWNRLHPEDYIGEIMKQTQKQFEPPSSISCDIQQIITYMSQMQKLTVLDLQGDMGFNQLSKILYTLRFGEEDNTLNTTNRQLGLSLTRDSKVSNKINLSKSADRL